MKRYLATGRQVIPCYAGTASAQIAPDGDVWSCCVRAEPLGNLRDVEYDFGKIWFGEKAERDRAMVRSCGCACPLANASYTNMLMHVPTVAGVAAEVAVRGRGAAAPERNSSGE